MAVYLEPLLSFLPEKYAVPVKLSDIEKVKQQYIAEILGLSLTAIKTRIQRARKMLKQEIEVCFYLEESTKPGLTAFSIKISCTPLQDHKSNNTDSCV
jgi:RNA polymerase sigma-70 factor (ECF subfamily)